MRQVIEAMVYVEIDADSVEEAYEYFSDGLDDIPGLVDLTVTQVNQREKPYDVPVGAEAWGLAAKEVRFDEDHFYRFHDGRKRFGVHDGSWWWTNGHVMLRCDGEPPSDPEKWTLVENPRFEKAFVAEAKRTEATFGDEAKQGSLRVRRSTTTPPIGIDGDYYTLAMTRGTKWLVPKKPTAPMYRVEDDGRIVAVVMPVKLDVVPVSTVVQ